jgi:flagellin-specific chaperone FliS
LRVDFCGVFKAQDIINEVNAVLDMNANSEEEKIKQSGKTIFG